MNLLLSSIGRRGYIAEYFRAHLGPGDRIIGTGNSRWTIGFQECDTSYVLPDIADPAYLSEVLDLCRHESVDAVLSLSDPDVHRLASARAAFLDRGIVPLFPSAEVAEIAWDKHAMMRHLAGHGVSSPRSALSVEEAADLRFPLYVKPRCGSGSRHVFLARDQRELEVFFAYDDDMLIQEQARGREINIQLCGDLRGRPVGICLVRKHLMRAGETDQAETFHDPDMLEFGLRLGRTLGVVGPVDVDVMWDGDEVQVLDVNTRFGGCYPLAHLAGADFPGMLVRLVSGEGVDLDLSYAPGTVMLKGIRVVGGPADRFTTGPHTAWS